MILSLFLISTFILSIRGNDLPCDAKEIPLTIPTFTFDFSNVNATQDHNIGLPIDPTLNDGYCGLSSNRGPGVWYKLTLPSYICDGPSPPQLSIGLDISDCNYDAYMSIYTMSDCNTPSDAVCIAYNDDSGIPGRITCPSIAASRIQGCFEELYILIHAFSNNPDNPAGRIGSGTVDITLECSENCDTSLMTKVFNNLMYSSSNQDLTSFDLRTSTIRYEIETIQSELSDIKSILTSRVQLRPTSSPTLSPTDQTLAPTSDPTIDPTSDPTSEPTSNPITTNYIYVSIEKSFSGAEAYCDTQYGTHLATIYDDITDDEANNLCLTGKCFVGLNDIDEEGTYVWTDGSAFDYTNWRPVQPNFPANKDCVRLSFGNGWIFVNCDTNSTFLCNNPNAPSHSVPNSGQSDYVKGDLYGEADGSQVVHGDRLDDNKIHINLDIPMKEMNLVFVVIIFCSLGMNCYLCHINRRLKQISKYDIVNQDNEC